MPSNHYYYVLSFFHDTRQILNIYSSFEFEVLLLFNYYRPFPISDLRQLKQFFPFYNLMQMIETCFEAVSMQPDMDNDHKL